jgi:hypothetical protein
MQKHRQRTENVAGKGAESEERPIDRFRSLARKLANVSREEMEEERRKYDQGSKKPYAPP